MVWISDIFNPHMRSINYSFFIMYEIQKEIKKLFPSVVFAHNHPENFTLEDNTDIDYFQMILHNRDYHLKIEIPDVPSVPDHDETK